ncbi:MAG: glycan-binding surface protein [Labilibaculum antarcticum]
MKKNNLNKNRWTSVAFLGIMLVAMLFTACDDEDLSTGPITISKVYLEDVNSSVPDREVTFARLGQLIRIEGSGFMGLRKVYINGLSSYFNPVYVSDNSMLVSVSKNTPTVEAEADVRNIIRMTKDGNEATFLFEIRSAAPSITSISHTLPLAGETITVNGFGLVEVSKVVFPGNVEVTEGITSDVDGEFFTVVVPEGVSEEGGSLLIECSNGGAYSPAYFNFKKGVILDFDGIGTHGFWGSSTSMIMDEDLETASMGTENVSQGIYVPHRPSRIASFDAATPRCSEVWTAGNDVDDWRGQLTPYIPATTPLSEVALQFDIYVPEAWSETGFLKICLVNGFNGGEWAGACYNYVPWIVNGEAEAFQTTGWTTTTIPLSMIYEFSEEDRTFEDILAYREAANYKNFGFYFENTDFTLANITGNDSDSETEFTSGATSVSVYTDNWRIVSLETPTYSDFPEDED